MKPFVTHEGIVAPLDQANVDTDQILPARFLRHCERGVFGDCAFFDRRFREEEAGIVSNPDFVLNQERYRGASLLIARQNFGCGSSREHAVWALHQAGFRAILAPSFADIFYGNAMNNGLLPVLLSASQIEELFAYVTGTPGARLRVDVKRQEVGNSSGLHLPFLVEEAHRERWLSAEKDIISRTLQYIPEIVAFEKRTETGERFRIL